MWIARQTKRRPSTKGHDLDPGQAAFLLQGIYASGGMMETKRKQHLEYLLCDSALKRVQTSPQFATFSAGYFFSRHLTDGKDSVNFLKQRAGLPPLS